MTLLAHKGGSGSLLVRWSIGTTTYIKGAWPVVLLHAGPQGPVQILGTPCLVVKLYSLHSALSFALAVPSRRTCVAYHLV